METKNEALEKYLKDKVSGPQLAFPSCDRDVARAAWYAAVKHTLEHVVNMLRRDADWIDTRVPARDLADLVARLKP